MQLPTLTPIEYSNRLVRKKQLFFTYSIWPEKLYEINGLIFEYWTGFLRSLFRGHLDYSSSVWSSVSIPWIKTAIYDFDQKAKIYPSISRITISCRSCYPQSDNRTDFIPIIRGAKKTGQFLRTTPIWHQIRNMFSLFNLSCRVPIVYKRLHDSNAPKCTLSAPTAL